MQLLTASYFYGFQRRTLWDDHSVQFGLARNWWRKDWFFGTSLLGFGLTPTPFTPRYDLTSVTSFALFFRKRGYSVSDFRIHYNINRCKTFFGWSRRYFMSFIFFYNRFLVIPSSGPTCWNKCYNFIFSNTGTYLFVSVIIFFYGTPNFSLRSFISKYKLVKFILVCRTWKKY